MAGARRDERTTGEAGQLGVRLEQLANGLFALGAVVFGIAVIVALLVASTDVDTFGMVDANLESQGRAVAALGTLGLGLTGAGILAGLGGILKALVRRDDL